MTSNVECPSSQGGQVTRRREEPAKKRKRREGKKKGMILGEFGVQLLKKV